MCETERERQEEGGERSISSCPGRRLEVAEGEGPDLRTPSFLPGGRALTHSQKKLPRWGLKKLVWAQRTGLPYAPDVCSGWGWGRGKERRQLHSRVNGSPAQTPSPERTPETP